MSRSSDAIRQPLDDAVPEPDKQALVHHLIIERIISQGHAPKREELAREMALATSDLERLYHAMAKNHAFVLHPHEPEPWIIHPFALSPTATWVAHDGRGWWAPCMWCALGIVTLIGGKGMIHTRLGGETQDIEIRVDGDRIDPDDLVVHFSVRPSRAWDNVHHTCACCLPFRAEAHIDAWSRYHGLARGEAVPIATLSALSRIWYGSHRSRHWRKWSVSEAAAIFRQVGLDGPFWALDAAAAERF